MNITCGLSLDGRAWIERGAAIGTMRVGPAGLLEILESMLGLTGPHIPEARRIDAFMRRLAKADTPDAWFHASFLADAWSTAKQCLAWRDELIEAGWNGDVDAHASVRLRTLADLERIDIPLPPGTADRVRAVERELHAVSSIAVTSIHLIDDRAHYPWIWRQILTLLENMGVAVSTEPARDEMPGRGLLGSVQAHIAGRKAPPVDRVDDDTLLFVRSRTEWESAEQMARWLAADASQLDDVTILCNGRSDILDQALRRHGLPRLGRSEPSRWRATLQSLPLLLANAWTPVDVERLVEFLSLRPSPVPRSLAGRLLRALRKSAGVGGDAWKEALEKYVAGDPDADASKSADATARQTHATIVDRFLVTDRHDERRGMPAASIQERCAWLVSRLAPQTADYDTAAALGHAKELMRLVEGRDAITRTELDRMLDSIIGPGRHAGDAMQEAAPWCVVEHPAQVPARTGTLLWWNFTEPDASQTVYWSNDERATLQRAGATLEEPGVENLRENAACLHALTSARERVLLFQSTSLCGEPVTTHPFETRLHLAIGTCAPDLKDAVTRLTRQPKDLMRNDEWQLAGRTLRLTRHATASSPVPAAEFQVDPGVITPQGPFSFSEMQSLLGCPMQWVIERHCGLREPDASSIPLDEKLTGLLCHEVIRRLLATDRTQDPLGELVGEGMHLFDELLPQFAAKLLLPVSEVELQRARTAFERSLRNLLQFVQNRALTVDAVELKVDAVVGDLPFSGRIDMLLRDADGKRHVVDLKWTSSSNYYRERVERGDALQLALYAGMVANGDDADDVHAGYFMLRQGELVSSSPLLSHHPIATTCSLPETRDRGLAALHDVFDKLESGTVEVRGIREDELAKYGEEKPEKVRERLRTEMTVRDRLYVEPGCKFCRVHVLCGRNGGRA